MKKIAVLALALGAMSLCACQDDEPKNPGNQDGKVIKSEAFTHLYVCNEGAWGANNARIDTLGFATGTYAEDLYTLANPSTVMGLGDVANDLKEHNGRLYAVINGSHKVEVMNAADCLRIGQLNVNSPRNIALSGNQAFVTSWVGGADGAGAVEVFNVNTLNHEATISVGHEPEGIAVANGKVYVAVSGGMSGYDNKVRAYNLSDLSLAAEYTVGLNPHHVVADTEGNVWVNTRGNYADQGSDLYRITPSGTVSSASVACAAFTVAGKKVYYYASEWNSATMAMDVAYGTLDSATLQPGAPFITDGTESGITTPYGIAVDHSTGRVFLGDAKNYTSSGALHVYSPSGTLEKTYSTGICPSSLLLLKF